MKLNSYLAIAASLQPNPNVFLCRKKPSTLQWSQGATSSIGIDWSLAFLRPKCKATKVAWKDLQKHQDPRRLGWLFHNSGSWCFLPSFIYWVMVTGGTLSLASGIMQVFVVRYPRFMGFVFVDHWRLHSFIWFFMSWGYRCWGAPSHKFPLWQVGGPNGPAPWSPCISKYIGSVQTDTFMYVHVISSDNVRIFVKSYEMWLNVHIHQRNLMNTVYKNIGA